VLFPPVTSQSASSHSELLLSPTVISQVAPDSQSTSQLAPHVPAQRDIAPQVTLELSAVGIVQAYPEAQVALEPLRVQPGPGHVDVMKPPSAPDMVSPPQAVSRVNVLAIKKLG